MPLSFGVTFDYRCPFARNAHEHLVHALKAGADWDVQFLPFSLSQNKVTEGETSVWDEPEKDSGLLALQLGIAIRDTQPERFYDAHLALFAIRHDEGKSQRDEDLLRAALAEAGVDVDAAFAEVASGVPLKKIQEEHERGVADHDVWGVPTFIAGDHAAFVRVMDRPRDDLHDSAKTVERIVGLLSGWPELNEFKHTSLSR
jgi:predicted DsbA family dithiol-disulfide isomerase